MAKLFVKSIQSGNRWDSRLGSGASDLGQSFGINGEALNLLIERAFVNGAASCILIEGVAERYILRVKQSGGVFFFSLKYLAEKCINREDKFGNKNALNMIMMAF